MLRLFAIALSGAAIAVSLTAYAASRAFPDLWWIEITTHFVPQQAMVTFLAALALAGLTLRGRTRSVAATAIGLAFFAFLAQDRVRAANAFALRASPPSGVPSDGPSELRIVSFNVLTSNPEKSKVLSWLKSTLDPRRATVVFLPETDAAWVQELQELKAVLPFGLEHPREDNYGFAIYSSVDLSDARAVTSSGGGVPMLTARLPGPRGSVRLIGAHTKAPVNEEFFRRRNAQLREIRSIVDESDEPAIVMGDLNCSIWSPSFRELDGARNSLFNPFPGIFRPTTWRPFRVGITTPIDHVLFTRHFSVRDAWVEDSDLGSDHQPVVVTLGWL